MTTRVNQLINRWITTIPDADKAYKGDAIYHAHVSMMRRMLSAMDLVMEAEGVAEDTRVRVIRALICGAPDETEALARMEEAEQLLQRLRTEPARLIVPWPEHWRRPTQERSRNMTGWNEHGHARKTGLPIDAVLGSGDLQDAENCGYNPIGILATMRVKPRTEHGDPVDQFRAGRIELVDGTVLERGGTLGAVWAVTHLPGGDHG